MQTIRRACRIIANKVISGREFSPSELRVIEAAERIVYGYE